MTIPSSSSAPFIAFIAAVRVRQRFRMLGLRIQYRSPSTTAESSKRFVTAFGSGISATSSTPAAAASRTAAARSTSVS